MKLQGDNIVVDMFSNHLERNKGCNDDLTMNKEVASENVTTYIGQHDVIGQEKKSLSERAVKDSQENKDDSTTGSDIEKLEKFLIKDNIFQQDKNVDDRRTPKDVVGIFKSKCNAIFRVITAQQLALSKKYLNTEQMDSSEINSIVAEKCKVTADELEGLLLVSDSIELKGYVKDLMKLHETAKTSSGRFNMMKKPQSLRRLRQLENILDKIKKVICTISLIEEFPRLDITALKTTLQDEKNSEQGSAKKESYLNTENVKQLRSVLDNHLLKDDALKVVLNQNLQGNAVEKASALKKLNTYIVSKRQELIGLEPVINSMMQLVSMVKSDEVIALKNAFLRLKNTNELASMSELFPENLIELDHDIDLLSKLNSDSMFSKKLFLELPLAKNTSDLIFARSVLKTFLSNKDKGNLTNSQGLFNKISSYLSQPSGAARDNITPLYKLVFSNPRDVLAGVNSGLELQSFLSSYSDYLNQKGVIANLSELAEMADKIDPENLFAQKSGEQVRLAREGFDFLSALEDKLKRNIKAEQDENVIILTEELIKYNVQQANDYINLIEISIRNYNEHNLKLKEATQVQKIIADKLATNNNVLAQALNDSDSARELPDLVKGGDCRLSDVVNSETSTLGFSSDRVKLSDSHRRVFESFVNGNITKGKCIDLLSLIICSEESLAVARGERDHLADIPIDKIKQLADNMIDKEALIQLQNKKLRKKIFRKKRSKRKIEKNNLAIAEIRKIRSYLDVIYNVPFTKSSFEPSLGILLNYFQKLDNNDKRILDSVTQVKILCKDMLGKLNIGSSASFEDTESILEEDNIATIEQMIDEIDSDMNEVSEAKKKELKLLEDAQIFSNQTKGILEIFSYLNDDGKHEDVIKKAESLLNNYEEDIKKYENGKIKAVDVLRSSGAARSAVSRLKVDIVNGDFIFLGDQNTILSTVALQEIFNIAQLRGNRIDNAIARAENASESELKKSLVENFRGQDESVIRDNVRRIRDVQQLKNKNQIALLDYLQGIEDDFNTSMQDVLNNGDENLITMIQRRISSAEENREKNKSRVNQYLTDLQQSFLGDYFDVDFDNKTITLKSTKLTTTETESITKKRSYELTEKDQALVRKAEILKFIEAGSAESYDVGQFLERLKEVALSKSSLQEKTRFYLFMAPKIWDDIFCYDGLEKYSNVRVKSPEVGRSLTERVKELQTDFFSHLWGEKLPVEELERLKILEQVKVKGVKEQLALSREKDLKGYIDALNKIRNDVKADWLITSSKGKKLSIIESAIDKMGKIGVNEVNFTSLVRSVLVDASNSFDETLKWYSVNDSDYNIALAELCDNGYSS